jgi:hypothetical protein
MKPIRARHILALSLLVIVSMGAVCNSATGTRKFLNTLDDIALLTNKGRSNIEIFVDAKRLSPQKALAGNNALDKIDAGNKNIVTNLQVFLVPVLNSDGTPKVDDKGRPVKELRIDEAGKAKVDALIQAFARTTSDALNDPEFVPNLSAADRQLWQAIIQQIAQIIQNGRNIFGKVKPVAAVKADVPRNAIFDNIKHTADTRTILGAKGSPSIVTTKALWTALPSEPLPEGYVSNVIVWK